MKNILKVLTLGVVTAALAVPMTANAQVKQRKKTEAEWQKAAYAGGALALLGQLNKDKTLSYVGAAGALYSAWRMEEDRKSKDKLRRERAAYYSRTHYTKNGVRYDRKTVRKNGKVYYTFVRHR